VDRLSKLIFFALLVALSAFWAQRVHAFPPTSNGAPQLVNGAWSCASPVSLATSLEQWRVHVAGQGAPAGTTRANGTSGNQIKYEYIRNDNGFLYTSGWVTQCTPQNSCPANATLASGNCTCNSGYVESTSNGVTTCIVPPCPAAGTPTGFSGDIQVGSDGGTCEPSGLSGSAGCRTSGTGVVCVTLAGVTTCFASGSNMRWTGASCTVGASPNAPGVASSGPSGSQQCPTGQCTGTVNGSSVCVPCQWSTPTPPTTTTSQDGTGASTGSTSSTTSCTGDSCTTTTITRNGSGTTTATNTTTTTRDVYCQQNPADVLCASGSGGAGSGPGGAASASAFGGSCAASFTCQGDAVQCAMAKEQHRRMCQLIDTPNELSEVGTPAMTGASSPSGHPANSPNTVDLELSSNIRQNPLFGSAGSCPANVSTSVAGFAVSIPFADLCDELNIVGNVGIMIALLVAAMIVFRSKA